MLILVLGFLGTGCVAAGDLVDSVSGLNVHGGWAELSVIKEEGGFGGSIKLVSKIQYYVLEVIDVRLFLKGHCSRLGSISCTRLGCKTQIGDLSTISC